MLQALKNLESRSPARPTPKPKPEAPKAAAEHVVKPSLVPAAVTQGLPPVTESIDALAGQLARLEIPVSDPPGRFEFGGPSTPLFVPPAPKIASENALTKAPPLSPLRAACEIERRVWRTLGDPVQAKPLVELASRLRQDRQQTAAKTLVLAGVGQSTTYEALLYTATLLAQRESEKVLLVDADLSARALSEALEFGRERGLGELLGDQNLTDDFCQPTAVEKLWFLPAGLQRVDASAAGARCSAILDPLAAAYDCVLIDGGRTGDRTAGTLARIADAAYLVVQLGTVEASEAQQALADFRAAGARVLGCIAT